MWGFSKALYRALVDLYAELQQSSIWSLSKVFNRVSSRAFGMALCRAYSKAFNIVLTCAILYITGLTRSHVPDLCSRSSHDTHARTTTAPISSTTFLILILFFVKRLKPSRVNVLSMVNSQQSSLFTTTQSIYNTIIVLA